MKCAKCEKCVVVERLCGGAITGDSPEDLRNQAFDK